jgi:hypothetical protein
MIKPTVAVVGQQHLVEQELGTNDKAGSPLNLLRLGFSRTIKDICNSVDYRYPFGE